MTTTTVRCASGKQNNNVALIYRQNNLLGNLRFIYQFSTFILLLLLVPIKIVGKWKESRGGGGAGVGREDYGVIVTKYC